MSEAEAQQEVCSHLETLDLERGLVTSGEDVAAMRRARAASQRMSMAEYLDFLASFPDEDPGRLRLRRGPGGSEPFTL